LQLVSTIDDALRELQQISELIAICVILLETEHLDPLVLGEHLLPLEEISGLIEITWMSTIGPGKVEVEVDQDRDGYLTRILAHETNEGARMSDDHTFVVAEFANDDQLLHHGRLAQHDGLDVGLKAFPHMKNLAAR
jgi:hypothetical protein